MNFPVSVMPMDEITTFRNFSLSRDAIKQAIESMSSRKTIEVVTKMLDSE